MINEYFENSEVKEEYEKEFISIFNGWLGEKNLYKLGEVTEQDWLKFNTLLNEIVNNYKTYSVNSSNETCNLVKNLSEITSTYNESMNKEASQFTKLIIPELHSVLTEDWNYTYILWHKKNGAINELAPLIKSAGLYQFNEKYYQDYSR